VSSQNDDQVFYRRSDEVEIDGPGVSDTELDEGELGFSDKSTIEGLTEMDLRDGETDDPNVASQEGLTYVPPIDPPVISAPDDPQGARIAAGFGVSADDEPYDRSHQSELISGEDEMVERVRDALLADAATTGYADSLAIAARGRTVAVRGVVDDIDDSDDIVDVISRVAGVDEVIDEIEVRGVTD
jgi:BON domain